MTHPVTAGIWQFDARPGRIEENLKTAQEGLRQLADQGAGLAVLPEMFSCGFDYPDMAAHAARTPMILDLLGRQAQASGLVIAGSLPEKDPEKERAGIYNSLYVIDADGEIAGKYRKIHLFPPIEEDRHLQPGCQPVLCHTQAGRLGLMICFDLRFPELCRALCLKGAQIVVVCAQWPAPRIDHWETLLRARAIENQLFMLGANRYGEDPELFFNGHSQMVAPTGEVLAMTATPDSVITAPLDLAAIDEARRAFNCQSLRMPSAYT